MSAGSLEGAEAAEPTASAGEPEPAVDESPTEAAGERVTTGKPHLLVVKGTFEQFGGAERDLLRNLTAWSKHFDLTLATLNLPVEARAMAEEAGVRWMTAPRPWRKPVGIWAEARARASRSAVWHWTRLLGISEQGPGLELLLQTVDAVHVTSGVASVEIVPLIPDDMPLHLHLLEPPRGLYEDVLHRLPDGTPKRHLGLTEWLLSKQRSRDQRFVSDVARTGVISGNSRYIQQRMSDVYDIEVGLLPPSVDLDAWADQKSDEWAELAEAHDLQRHGFVVTVGRVSFVKGTWETISMLSESALPLALVGGGIDDATRAHAAENGVRLVEMPRLTDAELVALVQNARAVVSHAHGEPFGLTPIEAQAAGTPALMVDDGGFRHTVEDGVSGRLLPRKERGVWHAALEEAADLETRELWAAAGRASIADAGYTPVDQADRLAAIITPLLPDSGSIDEEE